MKTKKTKKTTKKEISKEKMESTILQNMEDNETNPIINEIEEVEEVKVDPEGVTPLVELLGSSNDIAEASFNFDENTQKEASENEEVVFVDENIQKEIDEMNRKMGYTPVETPNEAQIEAAVEAKVTIEPQNVISVSNQTEQEKKAYDYYKKTETPVETVINNISSPTIESVERKEVVVTNTVEGKKNVTQQDFQSAIGILMTENKLSYLEARAVIEQRLQKGEGLIQRSQVVQTPVKGQVRTESSENNGETHVRNF